MSADNVRDHYLVAVLLQAYGVGARALDQFPEHGEAGDDLAAAFAFGAVEPEDEGLVQVRRLRLEVAAFNVEADAAQDRDAGFRGDDFGEADDGVPELGFCQCDFHVCLL